MVKPKINIYIEYTLKGFLTEMKKLTDMGFEFNISGKGDGNIIIKLQREVYNGRN